MKNIYFACIIIITLAGCATVPQRTHEVKTVGLPIDGYFITVNKVLEFGDGMYQSFHKGEGFTTGFQLTINNTTTKVGKIIWDNSSITDDLGTHRLFLDGIKFIDANKSIPSLVIPPGSKNLKSIYSADSVSYSQLGKTWVVHQMHGQHFLITLCIEAEGKEKYTTLEANISDM